MAASSGPDIVEDGLVLYLDAANPRSYPGSGLVWSDLSISDIPGSLVGGISYQTGDPGKMVFVGGSENVYFGNIPSSSPISFTENFTIEQVVEPTGYQSSAYYGLTNVLFEKGSATTYNYQTQITNDTRVSFIKRSSSEPLRYHHFDVSSMLNKIVSITFVISSNTTVTCYFNGQFVGSKSITGSPIAPQSTDGTGISKINAVGQTPFIGNYYSLKIYNRPLAEAEVIQNFEATRARYGI